MANAEKKGKRQMPEEDELNEYERQRQEQIRANKKKLQSLNVDSLLRSIVAPQPPKKKAKTTSGRTVEKSAADRERHNLRPRPIASVDHGGEAERDASVHGSEGLIAETSSEPKKKVRGITRKDDIWKRQNKAKLKVELNEFGQPVGGNSSPFANFSKLNSKLFQNWTSLQIPPKNILYKAQKDSDQTRWSVADGCDEANLINYYRHSFLQVYQTCPKLSKYQTY
uniref:Uncharacterized protein n=1 Tax=Leersia perrieri TaxID=77586 RepID=A0A0D9XQ85_9ORYZ